MTFCADTVIRATALPEVLGKVVVVGTEVDCPPLTEGVEHKRTEIKVGMAGPVVAALDTAEQCVRVGPRTPHADHIGPTEPSVQGRRPATAGRRRIPRKVHGVDGSARQTTAFEFHPRIGVPVAKPGDNRIDIQPVRAIRVIEDQSGRTGDVQAVLRRE